MQSMQASSARLRALVGGVGSDFRELANKARRRIKRRETYKYADKATGRLRASTKLFYALPQFSLLSLSFMISIYATLFFEERGASLGKIAFFTALARAADVCSDPAAAWLGDSTRTRWGRRRPYMAVFAPIYAVAFVLFFSPPASLSDDGVANWYGIFYIIFYLGDTMANVAYTALGPELTDDYDERSSLYFVQKMVGGVGILTAAVGPYVATSITGGQSTGFTLLACFFAFTYLTAIYLLVSNVKEREASQESEPIPFVPSVLRSFKNRAFQPLVVAWILDHTALAAVTSMLPFFITYVVQPDDPDLLLGISVGALFVAGLVSMPVWLFVSKRFGKRNTWLFYNLVNALSNVLFVFVGKGDVNMTVLFSIVNGVPVGGQFLIESILADTIDYDEFLNGSRSEGSYTVMATFVPKLVSVPASALPIAVISAAGFTSSVDGDPQPQTMTVIWTIRALFVLIPTLCTLISFTVKLKYPIKTKKIAQEIQEGVELHLAGEPARDPITGVMVALDATSPDDVHFVALLDHFSHKSLEHLIKSGKLIGSKYVQREMAVFIGIGMTGLSTACAALVLTFPFLEEQALAWIPSFAVILVGVFFSFTIFNVLRYRAAKRLEHTEFPEGLLKRVIVGKSKGQRGGDPTQMLIHGDSIHDVFRHWVDFALGKTGSVPTDDVDKVAAHIARNGDIDDSSSQDAASRESVPSKPKPDEEEGGGSVRNDGSSKRSKKAVELQPLTEAVDAESEDREVASEVEPADENGKDKEPEDDGQKDGKDGGGEDGDGEKQ